MTLGPRYIPGTSSEGTDSCPERKNRKVLPSGLSFLLVVVEERGESCCSGCAPKGDQALCAICGDRSTPPFEEISLNPVLYRVKARIEARLENDV